MTSTQVDIDAWMHGEDPEADPAQAESFPEPVTAPSASKEILDLAEAADYLGTDTDTLQRWRRNGGGPNWFKAGRQIRYPRSELYE